MAVNRLESFDAAQSSYDIEKNEDKDVGCATEVTALGVHLSNSPPWVEADTGKLSCLLLAFVGLLQNPHRYSSPVRWDDRCRSMVLSNLSLDVFSIPPCVGVPAARASVPSKRFRFACAVRSYVVCRPVTFLTGRA